MRFLISWVLDLFKKPQEEVNPWPFPVPAEKKKPQVKKATTRKAKVPAKTPAKKVVKKTTKARTK
jgi:hypothetical protein